MALMTQYKPALGSISKCKSNTFRVSVLWGRKFFSITQLICLHEVFMSYIMRPICSHNAGFQNSRDVQANKTLCMGLDILNVTSSYDTSQRNCCSSESLLGLCTMFEKKIRGCPVHSVASQWQRESMQSVVTRTKLQLPKMVGRFVLVWFYWFCWPWNL